MQSLHSPAIGGDLMVTVVVDSQITPERIISIPLVSLDSPRIPLLHFKRSNSAKPRLNLGVTHNYFHSQHSRLPIPQRYKIPDHNGLLTYRKPPRPNVFRPPRAESGAKRYRDVGS